MDSFKSFLDNKRKTSKKKIVEQKVEPILEDNIDETQIKLLEKKVGVVQVEETTSTVSELVSKKEEIEPKKKKHPKFIGEVAELPPASEFEEDTLVRKGQKVFIKQNDIWEALFEGNTTREVVKYAPVGGGCGVQEVTNISNSISNESITLISNATSQITSSDAIIKTLTSNFNHLVLYVSAANYGTYSAQVDIYTLKNGASVLVGTSNISNSSNQDSSQIIVDTKSWYATITNISGTIPTDGITVKVFK